MKIKARIVFNDENDVHLEIPDVYHIHIGNFNEVVYCKRVASALISKAGMTGMPESINVWIRIVDSDHCLIEEVLSPQPKLNAYGIYNKVKTHIQALTDSINKAYDDIDKLGGSYVPVTRQVVVSK